MIIQRVVCVTCGRPYSEHAVYDFETRKYVPKGGCGNYQETIVVEEIELPEK